MAKLTNEEIIASLKEMTVVELNLVLQLLLQLLPLPLQQKKKLLQQDQQKLH